MEKELDPESIEMFARIYSSDKFTFEAAYKAFAGIKRKKPVLQSRNKREGKYRFRLKSHRIIKWLSNGYQVEKAAVCEFGMLSNRRHMRSGPERSGNEA